MIEITVAEVIIAVAIAIFSGVVGSLITAFVPWLSERMKRKSDARYLAIRIVCQLDRYVINCARVAQDHGRLHPHERMVFSTKELPPPSYPDDINWSSVDHNLVYRILSLSHEAEIAARLIDSEFDDEIPVYDRGIEERQMQFSNLGLLAYGITQDLRKLYSIPRQNLNDPNAYRSEIIFQNRIAEIKKKRRKRKSEANKD